jgi:regulator of replication initiation timing
MTSVEKLSQLKASLESERRQFHIEAEKIRQTLDSRRKQIEEDKRRLKEEEQTLQQKQAELDQLVGIVQTFCYYLYSSFHLLDDLRET